MKRLIAIAALLFALPAHATDIQKVTSPGGITAWFVEEHSIPIVSLELLFRGGAAVDPTDKHGATNLMVGLLEEGAGDMNATEFLEATEALAARFGFDSGRDSVSISATMLRENMTASLDLLHLAITEPTFDDVAFERVRGQVNSIIRSSETNPRAIAGSRFRMLAFEGHPYARNSDGTLESVAALTPQDMHDTHKTAMTRDNVIVSVVGDLTADEVGVLLDSLLADLPETSPATVPTTGTQASGGIEVIDFPSPQSTAIFGHAGIERDDPDYVAAYVMNHILGTGFSSRLNQEVREKRGLTYGVSSFLVPYSHAALYMGSVSSENDKMAEAIEVIRAEWARMATDGATAEELLAAQQYLTGSYPLRFDSNGAIAGILAGLQFAGLPIEYVADRNDLVNAITLDDLNRVAVRLLQPDNLSIVIVGQPDGITSD